MICKQKNNNIFLLLYKIINSCYYNDMQWLYYDDKYICIEVFGVGDIVFSSPEGTLIKDMKNILSKDTGEVTDCLKKVSNLK